MHPLRHLVGGKSLADHPADSHLVWVIVAMDGITLHATLQTMVGQGSVHGFDDIAALAQILERVVYVGGKCPAAGFDLLRQSQPVELL